MREQRGRLLAVAAAALAGLVVLAAVLDAQRAMPVLMSTFALATLGLQTQFWTRARQLLAELRTRVRRETARAAGRKVSGMTTAPQSGRDAWRGAAVGLLLWAAVLVAGLLGAQAVAWIGTAGLWLVAVAVQLRAQRSLRRRITSIARPPRSSGAGGAGSGPGSPRRPGEAEEMPDEETLLREVLAAGLFSAEECRSRLAAAGVGLPEEESLLDHFLAGAAAESVVPVDPELFGEEVTLQALRGRVAAAQSDHAEAARRHDPLVGASEMPGTTPELDAAREDFRPVEDRGEAPLASVILPTWNRASVLRAAVESVQRQTYTRWELLVVDDGSTDDTESVARSLAARDERVRYIGLDHGGVSRARNQGLAAARGEYVAFLDSDKEWDPEFLRTMLAVLVTEGHQVGFAACEVTMGGEPVLRAVPPTRESLRIGNSVDQTAIVAVRGILDEVGGFDEGLRRAVDYDLVLKLSTAAEMHQVPFVGVRYSEADSDPHRISEFESKAWNFHVGDRQAWREFEAEPAPSLDEDLVTVVLDDVADVSEAAEFITGMLAGSPSCRVEFLLTPRTHDAALLAQCRALELSDAEVRVLPAGLRGDRPSYVNAALRQARGAQTLIVDAGAAPAVQSGGLDELRTALDGSAAVHPTVLGRTLLVEDAGVVYPRHGRDPVPLLAGMPTTILDSGQVITVPGAPFPLLARTRDLLSVRGLSTQLAGLWTDIDLSQKLARAVELPVRTQTEVTVRTERRGWAGHGNRHPDDVRTFAELWPTPPSGSEQALAAVGAEALYSQYTAQSFPADAARWTDATWVPSGTVQVAERPEQLRWAIRTGAPASAEAANWGDFHYANSLADALRRLGQQVHVDYQENALRGTTDFEDVVLNLRGLRDVPLPANATSLLWVISHPEQVSAKELEKYDLRYAASMPWARTAGEQWGVAVEPLLQCTDARRFHLDEELIPELESRALMVGNSRRQYRPAAWHAAHAGVPLSIWGKDWESQVPEEVIAGETLPNEQLARYYASARWVLNDHWPQMRDEGFLSNRIFDVLAAGGRLVTDDVVGLEEVFGDRLAVFTAPRELLQILDRDPEEFYPQQAREELSAMVREQHSFDARARRLVEDVRRSRAARQTEQMVTHDD
ncbi:hypothetical protein GCM10027060_17190 [Nesterenkonia halophila]|uniref:glycosyltransferase n=1 Tax=Nesterenkonia halophila TaxID=302044 RepID=UPI001291564A|nr:glycosyltransferase [Nesterenkonia halophila]